MRIRTGVRLIWLGVFTFLLLAALMGRLFDLQVVKKSEYSRKAYHQRTLPVGDRRGLIVDRTGSPLTAPVTRWGVAVFPPLNAREGARSLAPLLGEPEQDLQKKLAAVTDPAWLSTTRPLTGQVAADVQRLGLPDITAVPVQIRYGDQALARHLVGYINESGGQMGLERAYDRELYGEAVPAMVAYVAGTGSPISGSGIRTMQSATGKPPYLLETTIDGRMQQAVERVLDQHPSDKATVVAMDPGTGDVLAMASRPQFSYGELERAGPSALGEAMRNRALTAYPPGSVFKPIVLTQALETGKATLNDTFDCDGFVEIGDTRFADFAGEAHGQITLREAVAESCNVTFIKLGEERLGVAGLKAAAARFGFGSPAGLLGPERPFPGEAAGYVPPTAELGALQIAFGQGGLTATPLQIARAYAAIATGGVMPPIRLVRKIRDPAGVLMEQVPAGQAQRVMAEATAKQVQRALRGVTDPKGKGTGRAAWIDGAGTAGKTGTAEGAGKTAYAWFAGYLPLNAPRFVVVVMVEGRGDSHTGGIVAAPIFAKVGRELLATAGN